MNKTKMFLQSAARNVHFNVTKKINILATVGKWLTCLIPRLTSQVRFSPNLSVRTNAWNWSDTKFQ